MIAKYGNYTCTSIGVAGTTEVFVKKTPSTCQDFLYKYEVRMGVAIMGSSDHQTDNPFDEDFHDNYAEGKGYTLEVALRKLKESIKFIQDSLWC